MNLQFYSYEYEEQNIYGNIGENGWTGGVGALVEKKTDLAIIWLDHTPERTAVIDFLYPLHYAVYNFTSSVPLDSSKSRK